MLESHGASHFILFFIIRHGLNTSLNKPINNKFLTEGGRIMQVRR